MRCLELKVWGVFGFFASSRGETGYKSDCSTDCTFSPSS